MDSIPSKLIGLVVAKMQSHAIQKNKMAIPIDFPEVPCAGFLPKKIGGGRDLIVDG